MRSLLRVYTLSPVIRFSPTPSRTPLNQFIVSSNDSERAFALNRTVSAARPTSSGRERSSLVPHRGARGQPSDRHPRNHEPERTADEPPAPASRLPPTIQ